ncbi:hypothetical protein [Myxosarcina sp. GI1(2024)]
MISQQNLLNLADRLSAEDLRRLAGYLGELKQSQVNQLMRLLLNDDPSVIKNNDLIAHIIQSRNISAATEFWEAPANLFSLVKGTWNLYTGAIFWRLFIDKFGLSIPTMVIFISFPIFLLLGAAIWFSRQWSEISQKKDFSETI